MLTLKQQEIKFIQYVPNAPPNEHDTCDHGDSMNKRGESEPAFAFCSHAYADGNGYRIYLHRCFPLQESENRMSLCYSCQQSSPLPMTLSSFALFLGIVCYLFGFPLVFADSAAVNWRKKVMKDDVLLRLLGGLAAIVAALTLNNQWVITADGEGLIVFLAWLTLIKGVVLAWWPTQFMKMMGWKEQMLSIPAGRLACGVIIVILGAFLTYMGMMLAGPVSLS